MKTVSDACGEVWGVCNDPGVVTEIKVHVRRQIRSDLTVPVTRVQAALVQHNRHQSGLAFSRVRVVQFELTVVILHFVAFLNVLLGNTHDHDACFVNTCCHGTYKIALAVYVLGIKPHVHTRHGKQRPHLHGVVRVFVIVRDEHLFMLQRR